MKKWVVFMGLACLLAACQESLEERCAREAKYYTARSCPAKIEENVIIDSLTFERASHTLHYYYRLTGTADREGALDTAKARKILQDELRNTTSMRVYKDEGYSFVYTYRSEKDPKKTLFEHRFTKKDYQ